MTSERADSHWIRRTSRSFEYITTWKATHAATLGVQASPQLPLLPIQLPAGSGLSSQATGPFTTTKPRFEFKCTLNGTDISHTKLDNLVLHESWSDLGPWLGAAVQMVPRAYPGEPLYYITPSYS